MNSGLMILSGQEAWVKEKPCVSRDITVRASQRALDRIFLCWSCIVKALLCPAHSAHFCDSDQRLNNLITQRYTGESPRNSRYRNNWILYKSFIIRLSTGNRTEGILELRVCFLEKKKLCPLLNPEWSWGVHPARRREEPSNHSQGTHED